MWRIVDTLPEIIQHAVKSIAFLIERCKWLKDVILLNFNGKKKFQTEVQ